MGKQATAYSPSSGEGKQAAAHASSCFAGLRVDTTKPTRIGLWLVKRWPFYYGYWILMVGTFAKFFSAPGQTPVMGSIMSFIREDLGITKGTVSVLYCIATFLSSVSLPLVGYCLDRFGLRVSGICDAVLLATTCLVLSNFVEGPLTLTGFLYMLRLFGQGTMQLIGTTLISKWWIKHRGKMQGISGMGLSLSQAGIFTILARMGGETIGWLHTYWVIGGIVVFGFLPVCTIFFLETPEAYGMKPDNERMSGSSSKETEDVIEGMTVWEALRTTSFWALFCAGFVWAFNAAAIFFHITTLLEEDLGKQQLSRGLTTFYIGASTSAAVSTFTVGFLFDRISPKYIIGPAMLIHFIALNLLAIDRSVTLTLCHAIVLGITNGCMNNMSGVVTAYLFGRKHLGKLSGIGWAGIVVGSSLSTLPLGLVDGQENHTLVLRVLSVCPVVSALFIFACPMKPIVPPKQKFHQHRRGGQKGDDNLEMQNLLKDTLDSNDANGNGNGNGRRDF